MTMEESFALTDELNLLIPTDIRLYRDEFSDLVLEVAGREPEHGIRVVRCFPISAGDHFIGLHSDKDVELGIVEDPKELDPTSRKSLTEELRKFAATSFKATGGKASVRVSDRSPRRSGTGGSAPAGSTLVCSDALDSSFFLLIALSSFSGLTLHSVTFLDPEFG